MNDNILNKHHLVLRVAKAHSVKESSFRALVPQKIDHPSDVNNENIDNALETLESSLEQESELSFDFDRPGDSINNNYILAFEKLCKMHNVSFSEFEIEEYLCKDIEEFGKETFVSLVGRFPISSSCAKGIYYCAKQQKITAMDACIRFIAPSIFYGLIPGENKVEWSFDCTEYDFISNLLSLRQLTNLFWADAIKNGFETSIDPEKIFDLFKSSPITADDLFLLISGIISSQLIEIGVMRGEEDYTNNIYLTLNTMPSSMNLRGINKSISDISGNYEVSTKSRFLIASVLSMTSKTHHWIKLLHEIHLSINSSKISAKESVVSILLENLLAKTLLHKYGARSVSLYLTMPHNLDEKNKHLATEYINERLEEIGLDKISSSLDLERTTKFKEMDLPVTIEKEGDEKSNIVQTYLKNLPDDIISKISVLDKSFPNFAEITEHVRRRAIFSVKLNKPFHISPILIKGSPGIGKTYYLKKLKEALGIPALTIHASQISCGSRIAGLQRTWGTAQPGIIASHIERKRIANSIVVFDELSQLKLSGSIGMNPESVLLQLLDRDESSRFKDAFTETELDCSRLSWFFTANNTNNISEFLMSRMSIFSVEKLSSYRDTAIIQDVLHQVIERLDIDKGLIANLDDICCRMGLDYLNSGGNLRQLGTAIENTLVSRFEAIGDDQKYPVSISGKTLKSFL